MENTAIKETESSTESGQDEVLVVVSKLKNYVRSTADMNTSGGVAATLSGLVKAIITQAVENTKKDGRKTLMERDFSAATAGSESGKDEALVVVSKLKNFVRTSFGLNTSGGVAATLSCLVKGLCCRAIENAKKDGRKTLMERDFSTISSTCTSACTDTNSQN